MAADPGNEAHREPLQEFIDDVFEEMVRETGLPHKTASEYGKDPLVAALLEMATASLSRPSHMSEIERLLFSQALATALANALAPALANALAAEITKVLHVPARSGGTEAASTASPRPHGGSGDGPQEAERKK
ncbi:hypothetical protein ACFOSC_29955 [Streptantibioticus rubrisoli]|uniref:Uncharacterized protein n=1 Tax=Streptantibioticus rubrisoli TaxID=1387313 RepID=A0ABT1PME1_9ACTN|nr:hypothetical protein [Streptantibioticus rubrisoli]MCQ4046512.1 hypothetical protein [Streptantibioticus rubrisoli]